MVVLRYRGIVEPRMHKWSISFPQFPGVVTMADTFYGVIEQAKDALFSAVKALREDGQALPPDLGQEEPEHHVDLSGYRDPRLVVISIRVRVTPPAAPRRGR